MDRPWSVIALCAEWCGVCREWRASFEQAAGALPHVRFAWVDIEDEADAMGEVDVETFPTVLVTNGDQPWFLGPVLPSTDLVRFAGRLMEGPPAPGLPPEAHALVRRLQAGVLRRA
jgi:thioredoxin 1